MNEPKQQDIVTKYTAQHFLIYLLFGLIFPYKWIPFLFISFGWEIFERTSNKVFKSKNKKNSDFLYERWENTLVDIIVNILGFVLGSYLSHKN
jgi:hypothetical protein